MYPVEILSEDDDNGTMPENVAALSEAIIGHKISSAAQEGEQFVITLDNGDRVSLANTSDCCASTYLEDFLLDPRVVDHVIMGVGTTEEYTIWHIYADFGDIMQLQVGWSPGNPFYYGYGFDIHVEKLNESKQVRLV